jgi:hypothetical protein
VQGGVGVFLPYLLGTLLGIDDCLPTPSTFYIRRVAFWEV